MTLTLEEKQFIKDYIVMFKDMTKISPVTILTAINLNQLHAKNITNKSIVKTIYAELLKDDWTFNSINDALTAL